MLRIDENVLLSVRSAEKTVTFALYNNKKDPDRRKRIKINNNKRIVVYNSEFFDSSIISFTFIEYSHGPRRTN